MLLSQFIRDNIEPILVDWETFARRMIPPAETMSVAELRDHAREMLLDIADGMETMQSEDQRKTKSLGVAREGAEVTFAAQHGGLRQLVGYDLTQVGAEYRALRAAVLRRWKASLGVVNEAVLEEVMRFNEEIDQSLAEALGTYAKGVANSRDTFLAILGHDLRSPLGALGSCVQLFGLPEVKYDRQQMLTIAKRSIQSINEMVTDLLEYARARLGRGMEINLAAGNLAALCREAFEEVCTAHPERSLVAEIPAELLLKFDAPRMRQVLRNLLTNAIQHGDPAFPVALAVRDDEMQATMVIRNKGTPIPPDAMQVIFNPLVQIAPKESEPHERPATSLGLGLFIAQEIVNGHGGTIGVTSSMEQGTAFTVLLPRQEA